ncbi:MAG TPA: ABC transporter ATP-binding protein [Polyangiaceae bacterium LLY-WYZ-14_1]|nr:ABC transporter ATP-binding protein [Polyangiaceae bacterium LLY-WYZ-14_1]
MTDRQPRATSPGGTSGAPPLRIDGLRLELGGRRLLEEAAFALGPGECAALVGPNGSGKTTLLRAVLGLMTPAAGTVLLGGTPALRLTPRARAARVAWLPQTAAVAEALPAWEVVAAGRFRFREPEREVRAAALEALAALGVRPLADRPFPSLSGGERQRVCLAALVAQEAPLLLLDEPANHLDPAAQIDTYRRIRGLREDGGRAVLCVSHEVNLLSELAASPGAVQVLGLTRGRLRRLGRLDDPRLAEALSETFGCRFRSVEVDGRRWHLPQPEDR